MSAAISELNDIFYNENFIRTYKKGDIIASQGDTFSYVYLIKRGMVKTYDLDDNGSERTISVFGRNVTFPIIWLLEEPPSRHLFYYEAFTDVVCYLVPKSKIRDYALSRPELMVAAADNLAKTYLTALGHVYNLEKSHIHERLEFVLYFLAMRVGTQEGNVTRIDTIITQEDLANLAGVTRESMSLEINRPRSQGLFWKDGNTTVIDLERIDLSSMPKVFA